MRKIAREIPWFLVGIAVLLVVAWALGFIPTYVRYCYEQQSIKDCTSHNVVLVVFWEIGELLRWSSEAVTALATAALAIITWRLVTLSKEQSETTRAQLRAYLSVVIGSAIYQERDKELRFEAKPAILSNGQTPAYNVRYSIKAEIMTNEIAANFIFTEPPDTPRSQANIGPKENRFTSRVIDEYVPDEQIADILLGNGMALYVWGVVRYDDVFGRPHFTQFAQRLWWLKDLSNVMGMYDGRFGLSD
jgi:hypothetical protein